MQSKVQRLKPTDSTKFTRTTPAAVLSDGFGRVSHCIEAVCDVPHLAATEPSRPGAEEPKPGTGRSLAVRSSPRCHPPNQHYNTTQHHDTVTTPIKHPPPPNPLPRPVWPRPLPLGQAALSVIGPKTSMAKTKTTSNPGPSSLLCQALYVMLGIGLWTASLSTIHVRGGRGP